MTSLQELEYRNLWQREDKSDLDVLLKFISRQAQEFATTLEQIASYEPPAFVGTDISPSKRLEMALNAIADFYEKQKDWAIPLSWTGQNLAHKPISQKKLADTLHISTTTVRTYANGKDPFFMSVWGRPDKTALYDSYEFDDPDAF